MQGCAGHLFRIDHTGFHQVFVLLGRDIEAAVALALQYCLDDHGTLKAGIGGESAERRLDGGADDGDTDLLVAFEFQLADGRAGA